VESDSQLCFSTKKKREEELIRLKVNGQERTFDGDPNMPLLWYLRDVAGLTGTKFGCGMALCGACTVHQNGEAIRSCSTSMKEVAGAEIVTIEGIAPMHPVQKAWMEIRVPQCGYCQTGQIMQAIALLKTNKMPSDQDIDMAMSGNLCRCGTYQRIRAAIHTASKELAANLSAANQSEKELA
jgi:isoquinoline 1-oxidoreductase subunit alpha